MKYTFTNAQISPCGHYRYQLDRRWQSSGTGTVCWVMLNPSTADGDRDDPTIRRCVDFAERWGYAGIEVVNLFAIRQTVPPTHFKPELIGPDNDFVIRQAAIAARLVVCAWGDFSFARSRAVEVVRALEAIGCDPHALRMTRSGMPAHPLFLKARLLPFSIFGWPNVDNRGAST